MKKRLILSVIAWFSLLGIGQLCGGLVALIILIQSNPDFENKVLDNYQIKSDLNKITSK